MHLTMARVWTRKRDPFATKESLSLLTSCDKNGLPDGLGTEQGDPVGRLTEDDHVTGHTFSF